MLFSELPKEIIDEILIAAVNVRGIKRACRLRFVSKAWDAAVMNAIFTSRILDAEKKTHSYWPRYLAYRALGRPWKLSRPLRIIRKVAERLVMHQNPDEKSMTHEALKHCVFEICAIPNLGFQCRLGYDTSWLKDTETPVTIDEENDPQYKQALLAAAAWKNEVAIVKQILPCFEGFEYLIYHDNGTRLRDFEMMFGYPLCLAAFRGHDEVVSLFQNAIGTSGRKGDQSRDQVLYHAVKGGQVSVLDLALETGHPYYRRRFFGEGLQDTASLEIFQRFLPLAIGEFQDKSRRRGGQRDKRILQEQLVAASRQGEVAIMDHIFQVGESRVAWDDFSGRDQNPMLQAIKHGHKEVVRYLVSKGIPLHPNTLVFAARSKDPEMVQIVLDNADPSWDIYEALLVAVERENEMVIRMLLSLGETRSEFSLGVQAYQKAYWSSDLREYRRAYVRACQNAYQKALGLGLETMANIFRESVQGWPGQAKRKKMHGI